MTLKTGRKCKWEEIEVGEVFACTGCFAIVYKYNKKRGKYLSITPPCTDKAWNGTTDEFFRCLGITYYKLPLSVQRLWKEE